MKYLPLREFETVTSALNFDTDDCHIIGACDLYTVKAAGADKKLYKSIESSLESQHESLIRLSASLSPPNAELLSLNLSRSSPFGPLSEVSSRRTFAYLVATLNASHPDYDFSQILKPVDFRKEKSLRSVMNTIDDTLQNLRPRRGGTTGAIPAGGMAWYSSSAPPLIGGGQVWGPRTWKVIDKEMTLRECEIYCYAPDDDPFDGEESALWSMHYFFFNKERKRVCYVHLRGLSIASHSPVEHHTSTPAPMRTKRSLSISRNQSISGPGAKKRARYWLGNKAEKYIASSWDAEDCDDLDLDISALFGEYPGDDEVDADFDSGLDMTDDDDYDDFSCSVGSAGFSDISDDVHPHSSSYMPSSMNNKKPKKMMTKGRVRDMNEHIAETLEV